MIYNFYVSRNNSILLKAMKAMKASLTEKHIDEIQPAAKCLIIHYLAQPGQTLFVTCQFRDNREESAGNINRFSMSIVSAITSGCVLVPTRN
jgi:hypothetical protein